MECFEKENIWTFDSKGELLLTIMSSIAQEESRSISENYTLVGLRRRFEKGKVTMSFDRFLDYYKGPNGELVINEEQSKIVRRIYAEFLKGKSPYQIAKSLTTDGIPTPGGKTKCGSKVVQSILTNEKYKGDAFLQKVYTPDFLTKKKVKNCGQVPQYYVQGDHEEIIEPEIFDLIQRRMEHKSETRVNTVSIFSSKLKCGGCGSFYGSKVWHSNDKYRKIVWRCNGKYNGDKCTTPTLSENEAYFVKAVNKLIAGKAEILAAYEDIMDTLFSTEQLETELAEITTKLERTEQEISRLIHENSIHAIDQTEYNKQNAALFEKYDSLHTKKSEIAGKIIEKTNRQKDIEQFLARLGTLDAITDFDESLWTMMLDYAVVYSKEKSLSPLWMKRK